MALLTQEPGLMSVVVHLFFNIQHLTPSVVLKYYPPAGPNPPPDFLTAPRCPPPHPLILSLLLRESVFQAPGWWIECVQSFWCTGYSILSFFSPSLFLPLWWSRQPLRALSFRGKQLSASSSSLCKLFFFLPTPPLTCCKPSVWFSERCFTGFSIAAVNQKKTNKEGSNVNMSFFSAKIWGVMQVLGQIWEQGVLSVHPASVNMAKYQKRWKHPCVYW